MPLHDSSRTRKTTITRRRTRTRFSVPRGLIQEHSLPPPWSGGPTRSFPG